MKILNGIKLILDHQGNHLDSYTIGQEFFFAISYSKPALVSNPIVQPSATLVSNPSISL